MEHGVKDKADIARSTIIQLNAIPGHVSIIEITAYFCNDLKVTKLVRNEFHDVAWISFSSWSRNGRHIWTLLENVQRVNEING